MQEHEHAYLETDRHPFWIGHGGVLSYSVDYRCHCGDTVFENVLTPIGRTVLDNWPESAFLEKEVRYAIESCPVDENGQFVCPSVCWGCE